MKAIIIAAGPSSRLRPLTNDIPKCMLKINGKPIIQNTINIFRENGISDISVVVGYKKSMISIPEITYFENTDYLNNNILHSLMFARLKIEEAIKRDEEIVISYSDIWFESSVVQLLLKSKEPISLVVDIDWRSCYDGRTDHPIQEAENVVMDDDNMIIKIGKYINNYDSSMKNVGEFIGLWKFTPEGAKDFLDHFNRVNSILKMTEPYQNTKEWQKSYMTDIFQEMIDSGEDIYSVTIHKQWKEFDTAQDYTRGISEI